MSDLIVRKSPRPPAKKPRISKRMRQAVEALLTGEADTQKMAALKAGLRPEHLCRELKKPHLRAFVTQRSGELFADLLPKAIRTIGATMSGGNAQAALSAAVIVARQMGVIAPEGGPSLSVTLASPGYVIDLSGGDGTRARIVGGAQPESPTLIDVTPARPDDGSAE